jgi:serine/threonine protein kinase
MSDTQKTTNCPKCGAVLMADAPEGLCPRCLLALNLAHATEVGNEAHAASTAKPPPAPSEIAAHFPQLEILECLGRGGMGAVYKARQKRIDRLVALKILAPERQGDAQFTERFQREARALARLNHPNIVTVHDFGEAGGYCYLLMEFVEGVTLRQLMQQRKLSPAEALAIVPKICDALQFAHTKGIVHRDIKPENILLATHGEVKIADFGIAKLVEHGGTEPTLTGAQEVVGTPHYMAPEQAEKPGTVDHRADIFSLGVVIYEMLTSELPLGKFPPPSRKVQVDLRLDEIVLRALEKEPELRYQQASQVKTDLETVASDTTASVRKPATLHPSVAGRSVAATQWVILTAVLLVVGGAVWLWKTRTLPSTKPAGCVAWWSCETNLFDLIGTNNGIPTQGIGFSAGLTGAALQLDGQEDLILIPASDSLNVGKGSGFTLEAWINPSKVSFGRPIFEWNTDASSKIGLHFWIGHPDSPNGYLFANLYDGTYDRIIQTAPGTIVANSFQHVALTYDKASGVARLFINGMEATARGFGPVNVQTTIDLLIGGRLSPVQPKWFAGMIDEPAIYSRALSAEEIASIYRAVVERIQASEATPPPLDNARPDFPNQPTDKAPSSPSENRIRL